MALDGISAHFLQIELEERIVGARLSQLYQIDSHSLCLQFRKQGYSENLLISINPSQAYIFLSEEAQAKSKYQSGFTKLLRNKLAFFELYKIENPASERIFIFYLRGKNEIGDAVEYRLIAEIMGKHSNLVFLRESGLIYDAMRHIDSSLNRHREIMPARHYIPPPPQNKINIFSKENLLEENVIDLFFKKQSYDVKQKPAKFLLQTFAGFSPLLAQEVVFRSGISTDLYLSELSDSELEKLARGFRSVVRDIRAARLKPAIYYKDSALNKVLDYHIIELSAYSYVQSFSSYSRAMAAFYKRKNYENTFRQKRQQGERLLRRLQKRNARKRSLHLEDLHEGQKAEEYKLYGDLLQTKIYQIPGKSSQIEVENYYDENLSRLTIPLNPSLNASENVERYYKLYRKALEKRRQAEMLLEADRYDEEWLANLESMLNLASDSQDLEAILDELEEFQEKSGHTAGNLHEEKEAIPLGQILNPGKPGKRKRYTKKENKKKKAKSQQAKREHDNKVFQSSDGFTIRVGRNNIENDRLTFRKSRKDDLWFHAKNIPGSHTVLHLEGKEATRLAIQEAAEVAAYFSSANKTGLGAKIEVDYTPIKYVTKIPKAKPGLVNYTKQKTVYAEAKLPQTKGADKS